MKQELMDQLKVHFQSLESSITLQLYSSKHDKQEELKTMLSEVASCSPQIQMVEVPDSKEVPSFTILKEGEYLGITFQGIPGGHEFTSLILAILNVDNKGKLPDQGMINQIKALNGPVKIRTYISLSCTNCPEVVQTLNLFAYLNPLIDHTMIDGGLVQDEIASLGILGVPAVFIGEELIHSGKAGLVELLSVLQEKLGSKAGSEEAQEYEELDVAIIGGGPAGCAAAIYAARKGLKTGIIAGRIGGQVNDTKDIANLISVPLTTGSSLSHALRQHSNDYDISLWENRTVSALEVGAVHKIKTSINETFSAKQVIVATGASWRKMGIPGEEEYIGKGVAFCPHCDGPFFKGKKVAVIGGGNSGVEAAIDLAGICSHVVLIEFGEALKADTVLVKRAESLKNLTIKVNTQTQEVRGDGSKVTSLIAEDRTSHVQEEHILDGVFVQIGLIPNSKNLSDEIEKNKFGEILVDKKGRTNLKGIYAAGDVTDVAYKQIVIAMGEGAKASLAAFEDSIRQ
ncbi:alkyl hydroperoxide reductase subunit F [Spirochaeta cellobiosiphila]|uniref:alkyl hydroperoxide reductase subunit F n=1 Tax=Spirochaeta cellobiosiphila TaxID=504483 RepID=UPI0003FEA05A|nr:alkyl hydroperoxide reductase subunit F [Spirochaeta cellobiosiphila]